MQNDQSEIVKTEKEVCAEGLVVSGGGKDGIFIKEVKPESPASKNLSVKEGEMPYSTLQNISEARIQLILLFLHLFTSMSFHLAFQVIRFLVLQYTLIMCHMRTPSRFLSMLNHIKWHSVSNANHLQEPRKTLRQ